MEKKRFGERAVNKVIEVILSRMVDAEELQVRVKAALNRLAQGEIEAIAIHIHGYLLHPNLRVESFLFDIGAAAVNIKSAMRRKIELLHPSTGSLHLTLTETQLTNFLMAELQPLSLPELPLTLQHVACQFLAEGMIRLEWQWSDSVAMYSGGWSATPEVNSDDGNVEFTSTAYGEPVPEPWLLPAIAHLQRTFNLSDLANQGTRFQVRTIAIEAEKAVVQADAYIDYVPSKS
jgi:hypothetical protein